MLKVTTSSTSCNCRSQTWLVFIFRYRYALSITILIQFFSFLKMCTHFLGTLCICLWTHTHTPKFTRCLAYSWKSWLLYKSELVKVFRKIGKPLFWRCLSFVVFEIIYNNLQRRIYRREIHQFKYAWNKTYCVFVILKRRLLHRLVECLLMLFWYKSTTVCYS